MSPLPRRNKTIPPLYDEEPSDEYKEVYKDAVVQLCFENDIDAKDIEANYDTVAKILQIVADYLQNWKKFTNESFNVTKSKAHIHLFDVIRNLIRTKRLFKR